MRKSYIVLLKIVLAAFLMALSIVLTRFASFYITITGFPSQRFGFGSIPIVLSSLLCGPILGTIVGAGADLIGAFAFPSGPYFYGYTISSAIMGLIPWIIFTIFKNKRKSLIFTDIHFYIFTLLGVSIYIFSSTSYNNGKPNSKYYFEFTPGIRILIISILLAIGIICIISCYASYKYQTSSNLNVVSEKVLKKYDLLRQKGMDKSESINLIKSKLKSGCVTFSLFINYSLLDINLKTKNEINRMLRIIKKKDDDQLKFYKYEPSNYSYLEIFSILLINGIITNVFLLPLWNQIFYGLPYGYSLFNSTFNFFISLPFKLILTWVIIKAIESTNLFSLLNAKERHYKHIVNK